MAGEIQAKWSAGRTLYAVIRNKNGQVWNVDDLNEFETYVTANFTHYALQLTEQGTASGFYVGTFPVSIPAGIYSIVVAVQSGAFPAETDQSVSVGDFNWSGTTVLGLSDLATSGQLGKWMPTQLARSFMVKNFPLVFKSAADHVTPIVSGIVSGQISKDGAATFSPLESGAFTPVANGCYWLQALTSGDLNANTIHLRFTAVETSGGPADPVTFGFILQRNSG